MSNLHEVFALARKVQVSMTLLGHTKEFGQELDRRFEEIRESIKIERGMTEEQMLKIHHDNELPEVAQALFDDFVRWLNKQDIETPHTTDQQSLHVGDRVEFDPHVNPDGSLEARNIRKIPFVKKITH